MTLEEQEAVYAQQAKIEEVIDLNEQIVNLESKILDLYELLKENNIDINHIPEKYSYSYKRKAKIREYKRFLEERLSNLESYVSEVIKTNDENSNN